MKLVMVLMLAALPLYCYAGLGCQLMGDLVSKTADEAVSIEEYVAFVSEFINTDTEREAVVNFKQCFLNQDNKTLENFLALEDIITDSLYCAPF
ncbi:mammaglobin-B-like isoform X3 [Ochotona curzoniae]|uniref:mammaglobin-B-like isoform X3 n=1 Tax=Ochotona curzoniae TaxID=130825 RepID=UPI001B350495|nr:mammaglobin-B-like isoform X3 [Ochotona curzoniae]